MSIELGMATSVLKQAVDLGSATRGLQQVVDNPGIFGDNIVAIRTAADATTETVSKHADMPALKSLLSEARAGASELGYIAAYGDETLRQLGGREVLVMFNDAQVGTLTHHLSVMKQLGG